MESEQNSGVSDTNNTNFQDFNSYFDSFNKEIGSGDGSGAESNGARPSQLLVQVMYS